MKLTVAATDDKDDEYAAAVKLGSRARVNFIGGNLSLDGPQDSPNTGNWTLGSTTPGDNGTAIAQFSAVCWAHGRMIAEWLLEKHGKAAPVVGMVEVSVGGTTIHHWVPDYVGNYCNKTGILPNKGECVQYPPGWIFDGSVHRPTSSTVYQQSFNCAKVTYLARAGGMWRPRKMNPMLLDGKGFSAREVIYYQGEADSGKTCQHSDQTDLRRRYTTAAHSGRGEWT